MKLWYMCVILALCANISTSNKDNEESIKHLQEPIKQNRIDIDLTTMLECVRKFITTGITGIGPLDPFKLPILPLNLNSPFITSNLVLTKLLLEGLGGFTIQQASGVANILPPKINLALDLSWHQIKASTGYNGDMTLLGMIDLYGKGDASLELENFGVIVDIEIKGLPLQVTTSRITLALPVTKEVKVTGLFNDEILSDIISRQATETLNALATEYVNEVNVLINQLTTKLIETLVNPFLSTISIMDIIGIITGGGLSCDLAVVQNTSYANETVKYILSTLKDISYYRYENIN